MTYPVFELERVGFNYPYGEPLFTDLNLKITAGEKVCLLGANGSGKSTLLKMLCGLVFPHAGRLQAFGTQIDEQLLEDDQFAREYHRRVGFIFQNSEVQLFTTRVEDEIAFGPLQMGLDLETVQQRVNDVLKLLRIEHLVERSPYRLSGGEKKKVAVAAVLAMNPQVLILDEPTNGLDPKSQRWLIDLLLELNQAGRTIITATHHLDLAHVISDRVLVLSEEHELVYDGSAARLLGNKDLLIQVNLLDEYYHSHDQGGHFHLYRHG
ncbi:MAG: ABC transporter ATP-binding protein [Syntrophomonadaceae bacterium]|jgi:cobalt/nickel transport system ATP-binding protein|nr:ABC transporter ATP-binding protein [Syntrophomonadaceae bacterium]